MSGVEQVSVGRDDVLDGGREWMLGCQSVVGHDDGGIEA
jgi:hypothetical protein